MSSKPEDIRTADLHIPVDIAEYLFTRLKQMGCDSIHGVPGDFNLVALDYVPKVGLKWAGNCNELNAAYAADGYARVKGIAAIVTTFGVGELSAINGIAGSYSEQVPVVHIVGTPSTVSQKNGMLLHHTLGNGDFNVFSDMSKEISCAMAKLTHADDAASLIDNALRECWVQSRPVYIALPTDMVEKKVEGKRLQTPINLSFPENNPEKEKYVLDVIFKYLYAAKDPIILVDSCAIRHRVLKETHEFIEKSGLPVFVAPMGKSAINESHPNYGGVYAGDGSLPEVKKRVEAADLVLNIGAIKSDFNTGGFSYKTSQLNTIDLHSTFTKVRYSEYPGVSMRGLLRNLAKSIDTKKLTRSALPVPVPKNRVAENSGRSEIITQAMLWPTVGEFFEENDIVVTETGTSNFGIWETKFPPGVTALSQVLWGSIGWSVGACQGAALAAVDAGGKRRTILFVGDGSFQLTAQEVSTMLRLDLKPIIFILCNDGYTIERFIHGMDAEYNDIATWKHKNLIDAFGGAAKGARTYQVKTQNQVRELFDAKEFKSANVLQLVEVFIPKEDAPGALKMTAEASAKTNAN
ncbi:pyruvate decarboxylase [Pseudogymnoascus sp. 05NY08]|nr:pyruvate decarboxylase [Pseudogymnoascus sp. 05NY08]